MEKYNDAVNNFWAACKRLGLRRYVNYWREVVVVVCFLQGKALLFHRGTRLPRQTALQ